MIDHSEQFAQMDEENKSEQTQIMLQDFVSKRAVLQNDLLRTMSLNCIEKCSQLTPTKPEAIELDFTSQEKQCLAMCEAKVIKLNSIIERHLSDTFNPQFMQKYI
mmetsp:Transcript_34011/g.24540  ORF Transcript_34011/g.24540 Transcript_34011/m.24540 type:complete len:105 (-) Transcript_34011:102-416(-)